MPSAPPLSDRTLKYGRNAMATAGVMIVLAWAPGIDVAKFKPFGLDVSPGGELSIWVVLCAVLIYYFASFWFAAKIDIAVWNREQCGPLEEWESTESAKRQVDRGDKFDFNARQQIGLRLLLTRPLRDSIWRLRVDLVLPAAMFLLAMTATIWRIAGLWLVGYIGI